MSDDEPDYMSDAFLTEAVSEDVRPGLLHSHKQKREHELWKKREVSGEERKITKPSGRLEAEVREDGLQKPIPQDNKGFAMLAKMGFNPGKGLGKHGQGRMDPIGIDLKTDKQGLGRKAAVKEILEMKRKMLEEHKKKALSVTDFRASLSEKVQERQANVDLMKSQRICHTMDSDSGISDPEESWFWPDFTVQDDEDESCSKEISSDEEPMDEDEIQLAVREKLELLTMYLRRTYCYCVWCGVKYEDEDDLRECPGPTRSDHDS